MGLGAVAGRASLPALRRAALWAAFMTRPPDAPRSRRAAVIVSNAAVVFLAALTAALVWLFITAAAPLIHSDPIATPTTPKTVAIAQTVDPTQHLAYAAMATFYAPTATPPTPTPPPAPTADPRLFCLPSVAVAGHPCTVPPPPAPTPTPLAECPRDLSQATPYSECLWRGRP